MLRLARAAPAGWALRVSICLWGLCVPLDASARAPTPCVALAGLPTGCPSKWISNGLQVVRLWQKDLAKINPKAAESLANPEEYPNLFPNLQVGRALPCRRGCQQAAQAPTEGVLRQGDNPAHCLPKPPRLSQ